MPSADLNAQSPVQPAPTGPAPRYRAKHKIRVVTAAALFDGHDAAIGVMRRVLQGSGAEVIHLGHNRGAEEVVDAAIQEDAQAIALSSYQGGHVEYFKYMYDLLRQKGAGHITIWGGGGGVIVPREIAALHAHGINRIFSPEDGRRHGLQGMIDMIVQGADFSTEPADPLSELAAVTRPGARDQADHKSRLARLITAVEALPDGEHPLRAALQSGDTPVVPVLGITGTGGAGKSSLTDELLSRLLRDHPDRHIAVVSVDPTRRRTGGALLGDRIRMNSLRDPHAYMRSMATRQAGVELSRATDDVVRLIKRAGYDLVIVETSGIGQGDAEITRLADLCLYVMTAEYGAPSQLEKIEMLDLAQLVAINKFEHKGSKDALRDVRKQFRRNREVPWGVPDEALPVFGTVASRFHDSGVNGLYAAVCEGLSGLPGGARGPWVCKIAADQRALASDTRDLIPPERTRYLAEIVRSVRDYKARAHQQVQRARELQALRTAKRLLADESGVDAAAIDRAIVKADSRLDADARTALSELPRLREAYAQDEYVIKIRNAEVRYPTHVTTLSGTRQPRVAVPQDDEPGALIRFALLENLPGYFPFTAGVFPFKREGEDPKRMFAGEGGPSRTNERFHYLSAGEPAKRLSTAFDSVTLYGCDPDERPDIFGKIGESGVSVCTLEDARDLYAGFDLCDPTTSVSMTINGPAPIVLALFMNTAIDQQVARAEADKGSPLTGPELEAVRDRTLKVVRGTVQADILKEDQAQNTCIFSIEFALRMMGDIQEYFIRKQVRNYYSVSISGYHIAEAGANPISQLAFTLGNGFTFVEYYRARGLDVDAFAPNLSFFFSNGLDSEYTVIGRVARRIWAIAMRDLYRADERSQKLKYHIQTSGRSLHAMEIDFNDIRTTLQALFAYYDHCNSLHTNAYDEAITTPTADSVRRAMAIQLIITKEQGLAKTDNMLQGSYIVDQLTELVEEAVLTEFLRLDERGGVLGAMERQYQRGKIQDESLKYEMLKHSGELPIVGVNTFQNKDKSGDQEAGDVVLTRASTEEKQAQIARLRAFQARNADQSAQALATLKQVALAGGNIFEQLMDTARVCSLGQISRALFEVGGEYRRSM